MATQLTISLLDYLAYRVHCKYLSDLNDVSGYQLAREIQNIEPAAVPLREWNDALEYLARETPADTAESAKSRLLSALCADI